MLWHKLLLSPLMSRRHPPMNQRVFFKDMNLNVNELVWDFEEWHAGQTGGRGAGKSNNLHLQILHSQNRQPAKKQKERNGFFCSDTNCVASIYN